MITKCPDCGGPVQCLTDNEDDRHPLMACAEGSFCPGLNADTDETPCPFHSAGNEGRCNFCEDQ